VLGQGLACLSLLLAVAYGVEALMAGPVTMKTPYHQVPTLDKWVLVGVALLVSPWLEELVYRGLLQGTWQRQMGPRSAWPVLGTLLLFTLSHADYRETPLAQGYVAMLGAVLGGMRYWSGSILPGVAVHAANNLVAAWGLLAR
jgi:membrane protease YdiL (CAAX protease family)